jgi:hypothetical protein
MLFREALILTGLGQSECDKIIKIKDDIDKTIFHLVLEFQKGPQEQDCKIRIKNFFRNRLLSTSSSEKAVSFALAAHKLLSEADS